MVEAMTKSRATVYVINYLDWQREGQFTFDIQRAKLLDTLAHTLDAIQNSPSQAIKILLGGETNILNDIASINPDLLNDLVAQLQAGTLSIGSWYIQLDGLLANGEAFIRSLLLGQADREQYGIPNNKVALLPKNSQNIARLPQILQGFGINTAFVNSDAQVIPLPFYWQSPDNSGILVINHVIADDLERSIRLQRDGQPDGPFIWMQQTSADDSMMDLANSDEFELAFGTLDNYADAVRERLPDEFRPKIRGELYLQSLQKTVGRFSAHISYKQDITRLNAQLSHFTEPIFALASVFGTPKFPRIQQSLMNHSWRLLLQNMSPQTYAGAVNDDTYKQITIRNRQVEDNSQRVIDNALLGLAGKPYQVDNKNKSKADSYITVWNMHAHTVQQIVELEVSLPNNHYPNILLDPDGEEQPFTWYPERRVIDFRADVPSLGFAVYTLKVSREKTAAYNQRRVVTGSTIGSAGGESLGLVNGRLDWTFANGQVNDMFNYFDGGDAGDVWQYKEPQPDILAKAGIVDVPQVEATPTYERLIFRNRMRIAANLKNGKERVRGLRVFDLTTTATYYSGSTAVHFRTEFTNTAEDHRLRVHLKTGISAKSIFTGSAYDIVERSITGDSSAQDLVVQNYAALYGKSYGVGLFTRGLSAFEPIHEDKQTTLALSLLRSVGWLNKSKRISAPSAQMPHDMVSEFMLMPLDSQHNNADLLRTSLTYQAPLRAYQYSKKPAKHRHSYLQINSPDIVMTALKTAQTGDVMVLRLLNTSANNSSVQIMPSQKPKLVSYLNLAEESQSNMNIIDNDMSLTLEPHQTITLGLKF